MNTVQQGAEKAKDASLDAGDIVAGLEAGGTKCIAGIGRVQKNGLPEILEKVTIATTTPDETLGRVHESFAAMSARYGAIRRLGIGSFGPLVLDRESPVFGALDSTPKPGWSGFNILENLQSVAGLVRLNTDVNAAALAEYHAADNQVKRLAYVTVGTGLGVGVVDRGVPYGGKRHIEMGHITVRRHAQDMDYPGHCPFHGDCLEGLVCGPSITDRFGQKLSQLPSGHAAFEIIPYYLAQLVVAITYSHAPERIIFGGGVTGAGTILPTIRTLAASMLQGYPASAGFPRVHFKMPSNGTELTECDKTHQGHEAANTGMLSGYIQAPLLGAEAGLLGSMLLVTG